MYIPFENAAAGGSKMIIHSKLIEIINSDNVNEAYSFIASTLLQKGEQATDLSINELADLCYTSASTISRFIRKIGYDSYASFKRDFSLSLQHYMVRSRLMPVQRDGQSPTQLTNAYFSEVEGLFQHLRSPELAKSIEQIADYIHTCHRVDFYPLADFPAITSFQSDLWLSGIESHIFLRAEDQARGIASLSGQCMAILLAPDRQEAFSMNDLAQNIHATGTKILSICSAYGSPLEKYADFSLTFPGSGTGIDIYGFNALLSLVNVIFRAKYL